MGPVGACSNPNTPTMVAKWVTRLRACVVQLLRDTTDEAQTSVTAAQLTEMTLFNRGNCGLKDFQPPTGGVGPVGGLLGA